MHDPFDLRRFVAAQAPVMPQVLQDLGGSAMALLRGA